MANPLRRIARLYGIQTDYYDGLGRYRSAPPDAILKVLQSLGAQASSFDELPAALRERRQALWQQAIEPVTVAWQGRPLTVSLRLPATLAESAASCHIALESGDTIDSRCAEARAPVPKEVDGTRYVKRRIIISVELPVGYHRLQLEIADRRLESYLFSAPPSAYTQPGARKRWGLFCPLYALRSAENWGAGDFADLGDFLDFTAELNGDAVATLPLLAGFLEEPFNPSPYAPVSRIFWNEFFLDVEKIPELENCAKAKALLQSDDFCRGLETLRAPPLVDYRGVMAHKRGVLWELYRFFRRVRSTRKEHFERYVESHPLARDYSAFRAKVERERTVWSQWEAESRDGRLKPKDYDREVQYYHVYVQWLCAEQTAALAQKARQTGTGLYLDFPLGVNRDGYDVWRERPLFALEASGGAPPDGLFVKGQNWGFPPLRPEALRRQGYRYYIHCLRHHMAQAAMLRVDHIMGIHRGYWIPQGCDATEGMYLRYPATEFYAIFNIESHRHRVEIVGENLGTVPTYVNEAMRRHGFLGMHVAQFGVAADPARALDLPPRPTVASLNTHDTATFMGFWTGAEIDDRASLGLIDAAQAEDEHKFRAAQRHALSSFLHSMGYIPEPTADAAAVLGAWLAFLAGGEEEFLLVNLEDLWLEPAPQNVPGTWQERPNWQRKARLSLRQLRAVEPAIALLRKINDIRSGIR